MNLDELKAEIDKLSPIKIAFVANVVDSLAHPPRSDIQVPDTWITGSPAWMEYFGLALSVHHAATTEPLLLTAFETVFRNACRAAGWPTDVPGSTTRRFLDLEVAPDDGVWRRLSLKSTAAKSLRQTTAHISKLTEAAWIQDVRTPTARRTAVRELFRRYGEAVDAIVMLRAFRDGTTISRYQLVEIPVAIFDSVHTALLSDFQSDAPAIPCVRDGATVATIVVDRSDAKITVRNIRLAACVVHAEWRRTPP